MSRPTLEARPSSRRAELEKLLQAYFVGQRHLRRGICYLNAGQFDRATEEFTKASTANPNSAELPRYLSAALVGAERFNEARRVLEKKTTGIGATPADIIRQAMLHWRTGQPNDAVGMLRQGVAQFPDNAEIQFQLGTLLADQDEPEEAELRFTQAIAIDKGHAEALVSLAMCHGMRQDAAGAVALLERAQRLRPTSARIALLLSMAAQAKCAQGSTVNVRADMPDEPVVSDEGVQELSRLIEADPDFADAFLALNIAEVDETVYAMLARTIQLAIARNPRQADLHYQCGRVLERLGRAQEAIEATERAVNINPRYVQALIQLARLYQKTDRRACATTRLEQTILLGAEYADTYYLLGNLYRDSGQLERARWAYEHALRINSSFEAAREALASLAA